MLGPDILDMKRRPATQETVRLFNGPGNNGTSIRDGKTYNLKPGDVVVIPAGTGHWFTKIDDHIVYLMVRIDPDTVTPPIVSPLADVMVPARSASARAAPGVNVAAPNTAAMAITLAPANCCGVFIGFLPRGSLRSI